MISFKRYYGGLVTKEIVLNKYQVDMRRTSGDLKAGVTSISIEVWTNSLESAVRYALALCNDFSKSTEPVWECMAAYKCPSDKD